jgi:hypothetical protein
MVAFDALLEMLGDIIHRLGMEQPLFDRCFDGGRSPAPIVLKDEL